MWRSTFGIVTFILVFMGALTGGAVTGVAADDRMALVIGNTGYQALDPVRTANVDARALSISLSDIGFTVETGIDLEEAVLSRTVQGFAGRAANADVALIAFFGRAQQAGGENTLLPVDTRPAENPDWAGGAVPLSALVDAVARAQTVGIVLVDAARDNGLAFGPNAPAGIGPVGGVPSGVVVSLSARPGDVVDDGYRFSGAYATALGQHLDTQGVQLSDVLLRVRQAVINDTTGEQEPTAYGNATAIDFIPNPVPEPVAEPEQVADAGEATPDTGEADASDVPATDNAGPAEEAAAEAAEAADDAAEVEAGTNPLAGVIASPPRAEIATRPAEPRQAAVDEPVAADATAEEAWTDFMADADEAAPEQEPSQVAAVPAELLVSPNSHPPMNRAERERVQTALQSLGLYDYFIDAVFGNITRTGMRAFQEQIGAEPTGYLSEAQIEELYRRAAAAEQ